MRKFAACEGAGILSRAQRCAILGDERCILATLLMATPRSVRPGPAGPPHTWSADCDWRARRWTTAGRARGANARPRVDACVCPLQQTHIVQSIWSLSQSVARSPVADCGSGSCAFTTPVCPRGATRSPGRSPRPLARPCSTPASSSSSSSSSSSASTLAGERGGAAGTRTSLSRAPIGSRDLPRRTECWTHRCLLSCLPLAVFLLWVRSRLEQQLDYLDMPLPRCKVQRRLTICGRKGAQAARERSEGEGDAGGLLVAARPVDSLAPGF